MLLEHSNVVSRVPVEIFGRSEYQKLLHPNAIQCHVLHCGQDKVFYIDIVEDWQCEDRGGSETCN